MGLPVRLGTLRALVKEINVSAQAGKPLIVGGAPALAEALRRELGVSGGDEPRGAAVYVHIWGGRDDGVQLKRARRARVPIVAGGIVVGLLFQIFVNVGMTMGIAPITGIPLPFVSVGGSSMIANLAAMGVLLAIHGRGRVARNPRRR